MAIPGGHHLHHSLLLLAALDGGLQAVQLIWLAGGGLGGDVVGGASVCGGAIHTGHSIARGEADPLARAAHKVLVGAAAGEGQAGVWW